MPTSRPAIDEELRGKSPLEIAHFAAKKADNADQNAERAKKSAFDAATSLAANQQSMMLFAADVADAKTNARDAKVIGLALAQHFNVDLTNVGGPQAPNKDGPAVAIPSYGHTASIIPIRPTPHGLRAVPIRREELDDDESSPEITSNGQHVVVELNKFNRMTVTENEYRKMKEREQKEFEARQLVMEKEKAFARTNAIKGHLVKGGWLVAGGVVVHVVKLIIHF